MTKISPSLLLHSLEGVSRSSSTLKATLWTKIRIRRPNSIKSLSTGSREVKDQSAATKSKINSKVNQWLWINQIVNRKKQLRANKKNHRKRRVRVKRLLTWSGPRKRAIAKTVNPLHGHRLETQTGPWARVKVSFWTLHNRSSAIQKMQVTVKRACQNHDRCCQRSKKKAKATDSLTKASLNKSSLQTKVRKPPRSKRSEIGTFSMSLTT